MSRFTPILRASWLVLWRHKTHRDVRNKIVNLVASNVFRWETEYLQLEREFCNYLSHQYFKNSQLNRLRLRVLGGIVMHVEECDPLPFPQGEDRELVLQRIKARRMQFTPPNWYWLRLR